MIADRDVVACLDAAFQLLRKEMLKVDGLKAQALVLFSFIESTLGKAQATLYPLHLRQLQGQSAEEILLALAKAFHLAVCLMVSIEQLTGLAREMDDAQLGVPEDFLEAVEKIAGTGPQ